MAEGVKVEAGAEVTGSLLLDGAVIGPDAVVVESIVSEQYFAAEAKPDEVAAFLEAFNELRQAASTGDDAEAIIRRVLDDLRSYELPA